MKRFLQATLVLNVLTAAALAGSFDVTCHTIAGSGGASAGGNFEVRGTIAQPYAGRLSGGSFTLAGGFWNGAPAPSACPGQRADANCDGTVDFFDIDPFLTALFDPPTYAANYCGGSLCAADADCSEAVDFFDIDPFLACLFGGCTACP